MIANPIAAVVVSVVLLGQVPSGGGALKFMQDSAKIYQIESGDGAKRLALQAEPAFRLGGQGNGKLLEGAIFFWLDDLGRPEAAAQIYLARSDDAPNGQWLHEFTSLSTELLLATEDGQEIWTPREPGVVFQPLPEAPEPAATPVQRGRQMRAFAQRFKASRGVQVTSSERGWNDLRLLPTPIAHYGKPEGAIRDGMLFAFVVGTDPEVFLFVEERLGPDGPRWEYALAPMSCWPLKANGPGGIAWELPFRPARYRNKPLYSRFYQLASPETP